ncbi:hypothetical protein HCA44_07460 [Rhodococcus sp. HNM0569]|nr:hypothetical protein [Rhodococcus sp. HNM0569]
MGVELNRAAWMYVDQDNRNYDALNAHAEAAILNPGQYGSTTPAPGPAESFPDPARYVLPDKINLGEPETAAEDIRRLIADSAGWLGDVDDAIKAATNWSPLEQVIKPISGNWNELKRIGDAYKIAGEAFDKSAKNLEAGAKQVSDHWNGKAASAFQNYAQLQIEAMKWEAPVGRVIKAALDRVAEEIKSAAVEAITNLKEMLEDEVRVNDAWDLLKFAVKKIPVIGNAAQVASILKIIHDVAERVMKLVDKIREVVDALKSFLGTLASPSGHFNEVSESTLAPITDKVTNMKKKAELIRDVKNALDAEGPANKPTNDFSVGEGSDPWAGAV